MGSASDTTATRASALTILALAALALLSLGACRNEPSEVPAPVLPVHTQRVGTLAQAGELSLSGSVEGFRTAKLGFLVAGRIASIAAAEGQEVKAGQILANLDPENYRIALEIADAALAQVQDEYDRLSALHAKGSVSESDFAKVRNGLRQAKAQRQLQAKNLADTRLVCDFSGVLLRRGTEIGEIVPVGAPLFTVASLDPIKVTALVPESDLHRLKLGQKAKVTIDALDTTLAGKVLEVGAVADAATRSFAVKLEVPNPRHRLRPGMVARVSVSVPDSTRHLSVPLTSVKRRPEGDPVVYVVDSVRSQAFERKVALGAVVGPDVEVLSGLSEGQLVAVDGVGRLQDGARVRLGAAR